MASDHDFDSACCSEEEAKWRCEEGEVSICIELLSAFDTPIDSMGVYVCLFIDEIVPVQGTA
jgi:hypothetical protein